MFPTDLGSITVATLIYRLSFFACLGIAAAAASTGHPAAAAPITVSLIGAYRSPTLGVNFFGQSSSFLDERRLIIGESGNATAGLPGAVHVFDAATGKLTRSFSRPSAVSGENAFGIGVTSGPGWVAAGSIYDTIDGYFRRGAVHTFDSETGQFLATIPNPQLSFGWFGAEMANVNGRLLIGSTFADIAGADNAGVAYLFDPRSGALLQTLSNPTPDRDDEFGTVAASTQQIVIGARNDDTQTSNAGRVYVFDAATADLTFPVPHPAPALTTPGILPDRSNFGISASTADGYIAVGELGNAPSSETGAYVFDAVTGAFLYSVQSPVGNDRFGTAVAINSDYLAVTAYGANIGAPGAGAVYVFDSANGRLLTSISNPNPQQSAAFGENLTLLGDLLLVSSHLALPLGVDPLAPDSYQNYRGAAYLFRLERPTQTIYEPGTLGLIALSVAAWLTVWRCRRSNKWNLG